MSENKSVNIHKKLMTIQSKLVAPKGQYNKFGKYSYRSCEDILEAIKPILKEVEATLIISDSIEVFGDRYYIKATATLYDAEGLGGQVSNSAYAREEQAKKGMDGSQITGSTSSYARKYALNGLFAIDDTKDSDALGGVERPSSSTKESKSTPGGSEKKITEAQAADTVTGAQLKRLFAIATEVKMPKERIEAIADKYYKKSVKDLSQEECKAIVSNLEKMRKNNNE